MSDPKSLQQIIDDAHDSVQFGTVTITLKKNRDLVTTVDITKNSSRKVTGSAQALTLIGTDAQATRPEQRNRPTDVHHRPQARRSNRAADQRFPARQPGPEHGEVQMIKLNLGSGDTRVLDHISVDLHTAADVQHDLTTPLPYATALSIGSTPATSSSISPAEWEFVRHDWPRVLKPGGIMELRCPDMPSCASCSWTIVDVALQIERIYGQQGSEGQLHKNGFTPARLKASFPDWTAGCSNPPATTSCTWSSSSDDRVPDQHQTHRPVPPHQGFCV
jgi:hypothetical protein